MEKYSLLVFLAAAAVQCLIWFWLRTAHRPAGRTPPPTASHPVSIIVCFRNEVGTLDDCLASLLRQRYAPGFEVVLVDDNSTDGSTELALAFARRHDNIRVLPAGPTRPGKKDALAYGIAQARHERLLLTDADCVAASEHWITEMAGHLGGSTELVLGVSPYRIETGTLLEHWQHFESAYVNLKYLGALRAGVPYMGVGRNLAYTRDFFLRSGGFAAHADLPGGDDDLLVGGHARAEATVAAVDRRAWTWSRPQTTWAKYFRQRSRHQSTGTHYPTLPAAGLTLIALSHGLFYLLGVYTWFSGDKAIVALVFAFRLLLVLSAYRSFFFAGADAGDYERNGEQNSGDPAAGHRWPLPNFVATVVFFDAWVGPMYLFLALSGLKKPVGW